MLSGGRIGGGGFPSAFSVCRLIPYPFVGSPLCWACDPARMELDTKKWGTVW